MFVIFNNIRLRALIKSQHVCDAKTAKTYIHEKKNNGKNVST